MSIAEALFRPLELLPTAHPTEVPPENYCLSDDGKFVAGNPLSTTPKQMDDAFANWDNDEQPLVAFFHGGLVSQAVGYANAQNVIKTYRDAGGYPYFFVWRSGLLETIGDSLHGIFSNSIVAHVLDFVRGHSDTAAGHVETMSVMMSSPDAMKIPTRDEDWVPTELAARIHSDVQSDTVFKSIVARTSAPHMMTLQFAPERTPARSFTDEAVILRINQALPSSPVGTGMREFALGMPAMPTVWQVAQKIVQIVGAVIRRRSTGRAHPGICTITEEILRAFFVGDIGKNLWSQMKLDCADSFGPDENTCVGTRFLQNLKKRCAVGKNPRVLLVGHSAGAIYICEFLKAAAAAGLPSDMKFDIIFMAAACRFDLLDTTRQVNGGAMIGNIRNFAMQDAKEQVNALIQWPNVPSGAALNQFLADIYPASLLYFISGLLEPGDKGDDPLVGMQRFLGGDPVLNALPSVAAVNTYLGETMKNGEVFSPTVDSAPAGMQCRAVTHGGFPQEPLMLGSAGSLTRRWQ